MREWFRQLPSKIVEFWKKYTKRQKTLFFSVLAAVLIAVVALVTILNRTSYVVLSTFEDTATAAQQQICSKTIQSHIRSVMMH